MLQGGKFMTGQPATWSQGDWTGDGLFDQLDLVAALQTGGYLQGPLAAARLFAHNQDSSESLLVKKGPANTEDDELGAVDDWFATSGQ